MDEIDSTALLLINATIRIGSAEDFSTGFWISEEYILSCAHGKENINIGTEIPAWNGDTHFLVKIIAYNSMQDITILKSNSYHTQDYLPLKNGKLKFGDKLVGWAFSELYPEGGESFSVEYEGISRSPWTLKLKGGQITPGNSGAPLLNLNNELVGMVIRTRNRHSPEGGRAVPIETLTDFFYKQTQNTKNEIGKVSASDIPLIINMLNVSYADAKPLSPIMNLDIINSTANWREGQRLLGDLERFENQNAIRERSIQNWFKKQPKCLRFITHNENNIEINIGVTCVISLTPETYRKYCSAQINEFEITADNLVHEKNIESHSWICFQSFVLSEAMNRSTLVSLKFSIIDHIMNIACNKKDFKVVCEIGTSAGLKLAEFFNLKYLGLSKDFRPLFEGNFNPDQLGEIKNGLANEL